MYIFVCSRLILQEGSKIHFQFRPLPIRQWHIKSSTYSTTGALSTEIISSQSDKAIRSYFSYKQQKQRRV